MAATGLLYARKRSRGEEHCEFMPLSKRINNLHINNVGHYAPNHCDDVASASDAYRECDVGANNDDAITAPPPTTPVYNPGITASQSTYYFENKLLYELHFERLQRLQRY